MKRLFKIVLVFLFLQFGIFVIGADETDANGSSNCITLYAYSPDGDDEPSDDEIEPPDDPILNSPLPQDTVIFGPYGEPIIIILN